MREQRLIQEVRDRVGTIQHCAVRAKEPCEVCNKQIAAILLKLNELDALLEAAGSAGRDR